MESTSPVYPSAPGPFWLPILTPEQSPRSVDERRSQVNSSRELRNFRNTAPSRWPSGPLTEVKRLTELGITFLKQLPTTSDDSLSTTSDEDDGPKALADQVARWRRFSSPPDHCEYFPSVAEPKVQEIDDEQRNKWRRLSTPSEESDCSVALHQQREEWRRLSTPVEERSGPSERGASGREQRSAATDLSPSPPANTEEEIIEIHSSPPVTRPPFSVIPCRIASEITLPIRGSALDLAMIPVVPPRLCDKSCCDPVLLESMAPEQDDREIMALLNRIPCPSKRILNQLASRESDAKSVQSFTVRHPGCNNTLPSWVLTFWRSVATHWRDIMSWKRAHRRLTREVQCEEVLGLFSTIRWDSPSPIPGVAVGDLATFATTEWLSDNHINLLAWFVNTKIKSQMVRIVQAEYPERIGYLFNASKTNTAPPAMHYHWLDALRNKLREGAHTKIGFCVNVVAGEGLPAPPQVGNHWVAVIIDGKNRQIMFGDSMGFPPHKSIIEMLNWWLRPAFEVDFSVGQLKCHQQQTSWSCGDRAINMIAHHFDRGNFPLMGPTELDEMNNRITLFYKIVNRLCRIPGSKIFVE